MKRNLVTFALLILSVAVWQADYRGTDQRVSATELDIYACGDINTDARINILDVTFLIRFLYQGGPPPAEPNLADVDSSGVINLLDITYLINYLYKGGPEPRCPDAISNPVGGLLGYSGCKMFEGGMAADSTPPDQDCIEYQYDGESILMLKHVNAAFNCCPTEILGNVTIVGDLITITEDEIMEGFGCPCLCLYDVSYGIMNLAPGEYTIRVNGLYLNPDDEIEFTVNLDDSPSGSYCVTRDYYPWGDYWNSSGNISYAVGCKDFEFDKATSLTPPNQDCVEYSFDGESVLQLTHINAGFNCCPRIFADITVEGNLITVTEGETFDPDVGGCYCLCLFDVGYEIPNLSPGVYTIKVIGLYLELGDVYLEFTADLTTSPTGMYCLTRDHYPWSSSSGPPSGSLIGHSECWGYTDSKDSLLEEDCIVYEYDGWSVLTLQHLNDLFNCCPGELLAEITVENGVISIIETESLEGGGCDCVCLFDLDYEITNLPPGEYTIRIDNPYYYNEENGGIIEFTIDLTTSPSGYFCVDRPYLPWIW